MQEVLVITNCTNRKRTAAGRVEFSALDASGTLQTVAARWVRAIGNAPAEMQAQNLYMGRAFAEARHVAEGLRGKLHIVSAGLGIVSADEEVPAYDLTVAGGPNSLKSLLARHAQHPGDWWGALTEEFGSRRSVRALLCSGSQKLALFALPGSYVALIAQELASLTNSQVNQVRLITSEHGQSYLPDRVRHIVMPYDERLESSPFSGTRTDFAQRALRHFVEILGGHRLTPDEGRIAVADAMASMTKRVIPDREKKTDREIIVLLRDNWHRFGGASNRLLRFLRDDALVACEQSRFRNLWRAVQHELAEKAVKINE